MSSSFSKIGRGARIATPEAWALVAVAGLAASVLFLDGALLLAKAWRLPEYTHGPLIPALSLVLLHRQISLDGSALAAASPETARVAGALAALAALMAITGSVSGLSELAAYGIVVFAAAALVVALGWPSAARYWHPVLHLCFMLPLPGLIYYAAMTSLQAFSSEVGVNFVRAFDIPVVLTGNVIDMGDVTLLVAEACSGLRYMFPILSFSYVLAILYRGPRIKKALIFAMAVPTAVAVNALRVAAIGLAHGLYGIPPTEGVAHLVEGWAVFMISIGLILVCASALSPGGRLMLDTDLGSPRLVGARVARAWSMPALRTVAAVTVAAALVSAALPDRAGRPVERVPFALMEETVGSWSLAERLSIDPAVSRSLAADDVLAARYGTPGRDGEVELFLAYYENQRAGGVHSPEICLPGAGWEIETLDRIEIAAADGTAIPAMSAVIRRGLERRAAIYWFDQHGRRTAVDYVAKLLLVWDGLAHGRTDGALVRLVTPILPGEEPSDAAARLADMARDLPTALAPHLPGIDSPGPDEGRGAALAAE